MAADPVEDTSLYRTSHRDGTHRINVPDKALEIFVKFGQGERPKGISREPPQRREFTLMIGFPVSEALQLGRNVDVAYRRALHCIPGQIVVQEGIREVRVSKVV